MNRWPNPWYDRDRWFIGEECWIVLGCLGALGKNRSILELSWILEYPGSMSISWYLSSKRTMAGRSYYLATRRSFDLRQWLWRRLSSWKGGHLFCPMAPIREVSCGFSGCVFDFGCRAWQLSAYEGGHTVAKLVAWQEAARSKKLTWSQYAVSIVRGLEFYAASWKLGKGTRLGRLWALASILSTGGCRPGPSLGCIGQLCATGAHVLRPQTGGRCGGFSRADVTTHLTHYPWTIFYYHLCNHVKPY